MSLFPFNPTHSRKGLTFIALLALALALPLATHAKKKTAPATTPAPVGARKFPFDPTTLEWPSPPSFPRVHWLDYFAGQKIDYTPAEKKPKPKQSWMDRLAGAQSQSEKFNPKTFPFQLIGPYGMAVDSKGLLYVADQKVGAVFIFNPETHDTQLIRNGFEAHFRLINSVAVDDNDRIFVSDGKLRRVMIFNPQHAVEGEITEGLVDPVGLAIDTENRFLYVADTQQDQVLVYDADTYKLLRRIGTGGKTHFLTVPGDFAAPQGVAVDKNGDVYVTDTLNDRVEIFDADGKFISTFGKNGDGPGDFTRPKGIAVDCDGHIWVADEMQDLLKVFNRDGELLTYIGLPAHGNLPGQFKALVGVAIDKQNRVYTSEQYPGRVQMFRYITDAEAAKEKARLEEERQKAADQRRNAAGAAAEPGAKPAETPPAKAPEAPAPKDSTPPKTPGTGQ